MAEKHEAPIVVKLMDGTIVQGKTNLGERRRLSDRLNRNNDPFLTIVDAAWGEETGKVVFVNKNHIAWAMPGEAGAATLEDD
jgi:hypothetical protein